MTPNVDLHGVNIGALWRNYFTHKTFLEVHKSYYDSISYYKTTQEPNAHFFFPIHNFSPFHVLNASILSPLRQVNIMLASTQVIQQPFQVLHSCGAKTTPLCPALTFTPHSSLSPGNH